MTKIKFYKKRDLFIGFEVSGHTSKEEFGKDILCSAISTATQMVVVGIKDELKLRPFIKISDGYLEMKVREKDIENVQVQLLIKTCFDSIKQIIKNEKKYVDLEVKDDI